MPHSDADLPLTGVRVIERAQGVAAAYAGRLLTAMGAYTVMVEDVGGTPLRREPPFLAAAGDVSAAFVYLCAGKRSLVCDLSDAAGRQTLHAQLDQADILIDDTPLAERAAQGLDAAEVARRHPRLVHVSVLPFGAAGSKAAWRGEEVNLIHASGEGYLLPNGLSCALFPERPPLRIFGHFAGYQGGAAAAMAALAGLRMCDEAGGQFIDVSVQDAAVMVGAFAIQRLGDGSLEHRTTRNFRYGGVFETHDGYVELLMLEDRQWTSFVELMGRPVWALDERFLDPLERSRCGAEINEHIRQWIRPQSSATIVARAQALGVPAAKYRSPSDLLDGDHECARNLFEAVALPGGAVARMQVAPFRFGPQPLSAPGEVPELDELRQCHAPVDTPADSSGESQ